MVSAKLVIATYETLGAIGVTGNVTLGIGGDGCAVVGDAADLGACATGGWDLPKVNLADGKCEWSGVCTWENGRPKDNAAIAFCRFTFTFPRFSCVKVKLEDAVNKACVLVDITVWRARFTVNASRSCRTCEKRLTHVIRRKKGIDRHDVKCHIVHLGGNGRI